MAPRRPTYDWKARACAELDNFDVPFAFKEYVQNVQGQVLKGLRTREWSDWKREDLRNETPKNRDTRKKSLITEYPGLLTGPHGAQIKRLPGWQPWYILSARIPLQSLRYNSRHLYKDLQIALVLWRHTTLEITALSAYNNHLDRNAKFSTFTVDGASTSRQSDYAVGEKGKGFILATQFLQEHTEEVLKTLAPADVPRDVKLGASFRVGHQIGTLKWKGTKYDDDVEEVLNVVLDDLTPWTLEEYLHKKVSEAADKKKPRRDNDESDSDVDQPVAITDKFRTDSQQALKKIYEARGRFQMDAKREDSSLLSSAGSQLVYEDEVAITVVGINGSFQPEYLFRSIYGIIPPEHAWRVPNTPVQFFISPANFDAPDRNAQPPAESSEDLFETESGPAALFYSRDQLVPFGLFLNKLSINYHGKLHITSDRVAILRDYRVDVYQKDLSLAADLGFRTIPELAVELALDVLSCDHSDSLSQLIKPDNEVDDSEGTKAYRAAFEAALRKLHPDIPASTRIQPTASIKKEKDLIEELGLEAVEVSDSAWRIIHDSGAYLAVKDVARKRLLSRPAIIDAPGRLKRLRLAMAKVAPYVPEENVTIRDYSLSTPKVVFDEKKNLLAFATPRPCGKHTEQKSCLCWLGPAVYEAAMRVGGDKRSAEENLDSFYPAFLKGMNGKTAVDEEEEDASDEDDDDDDDSGNEMDVDDNADKDNEKDDPTYVPPKTKDAAEKRKKQEAETQKNGSKGSKSNDVQATKEKAQTPAKTPLKEKSPSSRQEKETANTQKSPTKQPDATPETPRAKQPEQTQTANKPKAPTNMQVHDSPAKASSSSTSIGDDDGDAVIAAVSGLAARLKESRVLVSDLTRQIDVSNTEIAILRQEMGRRLTVEQSAAKQATIWAQAETIKRLEGDLKDANEQLDQLLEESKRRLELQQAAVLDAQRSLAVSQTRKRQRTE
ncbi:hypothetical protein R3P38DRAFT_3123399 [Favolaschia claudopus]|uniref:Uncharacterized protein n=1 Tax=Favolaschia claudopus TaxID=2862362 RepID=A0AAV9ZBZ9_9AGAR